MDSSSPRSEDVLCSNSIQISESAFLRYSILLKAILCVLSVVISTTFLYREKTRWIGNPNTKLLFLFHISSSIFVPLTFSFAYFFDSIRYFLPASSPCGYVIPVAIGMTFRFLPGLGYTIQTVSMAAFAIERVIATIFPGFFEKRKTPLFALLLLGILVPSDILFVIDRIILSSDWNDRLILTSVWNRGNRSNIQLNIYFYLSLELATVVTFTSTLLVNKIMNKRFSVGSGEISRKYQISENLKVMKALQPCFFAHFALQGAQYLALPFVAWFPPSGTIPSAVYVELIALQPYLYILLLPLILHIFLKKKQRRIVDNYSSNDHIDQINRIFDEHFDLRAARVDLSNTLE